MNKIINWGILGTGYIANKLAEALAHVHNARLLAVGSRNLNKAQAFAIKHNVERHYGSYDEVIRDKDVNVIYVATPHVFHFDNTMTALSNGKAVLCEKPFAMNETEVRKMIALARSRDLFLMEALWTLFLPRIRKVKELIDHGNIGEIIYIQSNFGFKADFNPEGRLFNKVLGGGALMDIGIYPVFITLYLLGKPDEIISNAIVGTTGVDDSISMIFKYEKALANLHSTLVSDTSVETDICGTKGRIRIHRQWHMPGSLTLVLNSGEQQEFNFDTICNGYEYEAIEVTNCLLRGKKESDIVPLDFSLSLIRLLDQIRAQNNISYE